MEDSKIKMPPVEKAIGDFLGIVQCLRWVNDVNAFVKWMNDYHHMEYINYHLSGYKLLFNTLLRMLISDIERNLSLGLSDDELFSRASFRGKSIFMLPNTCEKTIIIKNIANSASDISDFSDWENLSEAMERFSHSILEELVKVRDVSILNPKFHVRDIDTAIRYSSTFQIYIYLNDTSRGLPHGYTSAMLEDVEKTFKARSQIAKNYRDTLTGYKYGVQYLWSQLLGDKISESVVRNLHTASNWESFDEYFEKIQKEIISPIEKSSGASMGFDYFILTDDNPKRFLQALLKDYPQEKVLSLNEQIKQCFLWYPIQLIDNSEYDFSGIPTLIPLLMGMIQIKRRSKNKSKAKVIRLIHGGEEAHRRNYSYAVLSELSGFISDSSGWILFYDCCSDRGSTSGLYESIESLLSRYEENGFVEISSIRIEKQRFIDLVKDDIIETIAFSEGLNE